MDNAADNDEADLVVRAQAGDEAAFGQLCAGYEERLRRRVERRLSRGVKRRVAASDVIQEAHIVAFDQIADFEDRGAGSFGRWLGRIVDMKAQQLVRHHAGTAKRAISAEVTRAQRGTVAGAQGQGASPSQVAIGAEMREAVQRALTRLPENYRQVVQLIQGEGLTLADAADRLGRSRDSIKGLYSRALARLASDLQLGKETP